MKDFESQTKLYSFWLGQAIAALPQRERIAVVGRFFEQRTFKNIGQQLGLSHTRPPQLVNSALRKLRARFRDVALLTLVAKPFVHVDLPWQGIYTPEEAETPHRTPQPRKIRPPKRPKKSLPAPDFNPEHYFNYITHIGNIIETRKFPAIRKTAPAIFPQPLVALVGPLWPWPQELDH